MAPRPNWKGYLRLSLVSCAVALYPASSSSSRISFNRVNRKTGNRLNQQNIDSVSGEPVDSVDQARGYEVAKGQYLMVEEDDLEKVKLESNHTIEIAKFVPKAEIDPRFMEAPYYIVPDDKVAYEPFSVIREAMREKDIVAIGRVVIARRERIVMLEPFERGILATLLRYGSEVRETAAYFDEIPEIKIAKDLSDLAKLIMDQMSGHFAPSEFVDRYEDALATMLNEKRAGHDFKAMEVQRAPNVIDLMTALKRSVEESRKDTAEPRKAPSKAKESEARKPAKRATRRA